ncbi:MAG: ABC transporter ATP-binding protein, partial [Alphaproteobacteria bacterium]
MPNPIPSGAPAESILYLEGVSVSFEGFKALNSLNLIIRRGE